MKKSSPSWIDRIDSLDLEIFEPIPTQTGAGDRRSLLAAQRAVAGNYKKYSYIEIGSHLGGSIQPHLADSRCEKIYSIDTRPTEQPDDRAPNAVCYYEDNSTGRMLSLLNDLGIGDTSKIECFDADASEVDPEQIVNKPHLAFIDGEHTYSAALSDYKFCESVMADNGVVLFHDCGIVHSAIHEICISLEKRGQPYIAVKLEELVLGIFFDPNLVHSDPYLSSLYEKNKNYMRNYYFLFTARNFIPMPFLKVLRKIRWHVNKRISLIKSSRSA